MNIDHKLRDKLCYGCLPYSNYNGIKCNLSPFYNDAQCPCTTCLVKMICILECEQCKIFNEFSNMQIKLSKELDLNK